jgi:hypothetical protein
MPEVRRGSTIIPDIRHGTTQINEIRHGTTPRWVRGGAFDDFIRLDGAGNAIDTPNTLGSDWTDHGPSFDWKLGVEDGRVRVGIPDAMIGAFWDFRTSCARYNVSTNSVDDGFIECLAATQGDGASFTSPSGFVTEVYGRMSNAAFTHGVGIRMSAGHCWLIRLVGSSPTLVADGGTFQAGARLRHHFAGDLHKLYVDGRLAATWPDSGHTASKGSGFRSLGLLGQGCKDTFGPRRFGPALDYVMMG